VKGSDGGASLYYAYLDLLNDRFNKGHLPRDPNRLDRVLFFHLRTPDKDDPGRKVAELDEDEWARWGHPSTLAVLVSELGRKWETTVNPVYAGDILERERQTRLFEALSKVAAIKDVEARRAALDGRPPPTAPTQVPRAIYEALPPETRETLNVVPRVTFAGLGPAIEAARRKSNEDDDDLPLGTVLLGASGLGAAWLGYRWWRNSRRRTHGR
jgi:hypothetical protein